MDLPLAPFGVRPTATAAPAVGATSRILVPRPFRRDGKLHLLGFSLATTYLAATRRAYSQRRAVVLQRADSRAGDAAPLRVVLLGGTGRIGTAVASHFLKQAPPATEIVLAGRDEARGEAAVAEVLQEVDDVSASVNFKCVDWRSSGALSAFLEDVAPHALIHSAGPFDSDLDADVLRAAIDAKVTVYIDVADPVPYIDAAKALCDDARKSGTTALVCAGAFPGFSNVLALECARRLLPRHSSSGVQFQDVNFAYFTAGLGGSGAVNLLITNLGFGEPVPVFRGGKYAPEMIAGTELRRVPFFLEQADPAFEAVGERDVWNWPFPEAFTVARHLAITGDSSTGMGTAPGIWNDILVALVALVPSDLWQQRWFSEGLAWFSLPMVWLTDQFVGETHAMRVEVSTTDGRRCEAVQTHESFRRCVAQSAAEFALHLLQKRRPGVWLPEEFVDFEESGRAELLERLSSTPGTISCAFRER
eukprot:TRINITY_DN77245_c0_g1_i1.p1 TRINITY_DN77245_c0_g1~~TRINITY_DN77245_c0_g1_i1.p1  ORF type:complete len:476 (+),score=87.18 TRINITY_DN77245_c0_g1_i1:40-1467(+)